MILSANCAKEIRHTGVNNRTEGGGILGDEIEVRVINRGRRRRVRRREIRTILW